MLKSENMENFCRIINGNNILLGVHLVLYLNKTGKKEQPGVSFMYFFLLYVIS